jgi:hypothetical protein
MNAPSSPPATPASSSSIKASLDETERLIKNCTARTRMGNTMTLVVGVLILGALGAYFTYGYIQIADVLEPKKLVDAAETFIEDRIPEVRKTLEAEVDKSAPIWAESLSKQAQSSLPSVREKLETYIVEQVDSTLADTVSLTEDHFRSMLKDKRQVLENGFKDLANSPALAKDTLKEIEDAMEGAFQADMKQGAAELFATLGLMNSTLARLKAGQQLTQQEYRKRQILMLLRRLQTEQILADADADKEAIAAEAKVEK